MPQYAAEYFEMYYKPSGHINSQTIDVSKKEETDLEEFTLILLANVWCSRDSFVYGVGDLLTVPGVDDDAPVQALSGTREFGQDHHALTFLLASNVFVRDLYRWEEALR